MKLVTEFCIVIFLIFQIVYGVKIVRPYNLECTIYDKNFCNQTDFVCSLKMLRRNIPAFNGRCTLTETYNKFWLRFNVLEKRRQFQEMGINRTSNICSPLKNANSVFLAPVMTNLKKYSNFSLKCPIQGTISLMNYTFDHLMIAKYLPDGNYKINIWIYGKELKAALVMGSLSIEVRTSS